MKIHCYACHFDLQNLSCFALAAGFNVIRGTCMHVIPCIHGATVAVSLVASGKATSPKAQDKTFDGRWMLRVEHSFTAITRDT
jgi:hypothetical protein